MSASPVAMKPIPGTEVVTYCCNANPAKKGSVDNFFVYIAEILSAEKTVVIKPLSFKNKESITLRKALTDNPYIASVELRTEGIFLRVHPDLKTDSIKSATLIVDELGAKTSLGKIAGCIPVSNYSLLVDVYELYYQSALETARRVAAQKKQQATSTGY